MYLCYHTAAVFLGILLDAVIGDPKGWYHPVMAIGWLIQRLEQVLRRLFPSTKRGERLAGIVLAVFVPASVTGVAMAALRLCYLFHPVAGIVVEAAMCGSMLAAKSLKTESMKVEEALRIEGLAAGREAVSMIVGRDTERLDEAGVIRAAVETVAENTSDGAVAPLLFMTCFGGAGGVLYKTINTMDSMVGYKNDAYRYFGTAAAKLDDFVNFIPARVSALLMILASSISGQDGRNAWRIFWRDRYCHASPNSAQTEAVMAGALGVRLAGDAWYFGEKYQKPYIGEETRPVEREDIARSCRLMYDTVYLTATLALALKCGIILLSVA